MKKYVLIITNTCNLNCIYCVDYERMKQSNQLVMDRHNIEQTLNDIIKEINNSIYDNHKCQVMFFGGEPTLSFDTICFAVKYLQPYHHKIEFRIMTNGTLLNQEMVAFFNKYDFRVTISWDGKNTAITRGVDVFKTKFDYIIQLNYLSVTCVMTKYNTPYDIVDTLSYYSQQYYAIHNKHIECVLNAVRDNNTLYPDNYKSWNNDMQRIISSDNEYIKYFMSQSFQTIERYDNQSIDIVWVKDSSTSVTKSKKQNCEQCHVKPFCKCSTQTTESCKMLQETFTPIYEWYCKQKWFIN